MTRDIAITAVSRVLTAAVGVVASIVTARVLGVEGRGDYFYVITIALLASQLASLGLPSTNVYLAARDQSLVPPLLSNSFWISLCLGPMAVVVILAINVGLFERPIRSSQILVWAVVIAPFALFYMLSSNLLAGIQEFRRFNAVSISAALLQLALIVVLAVAWPSIHGFLAATVVTNLVSCLVVIWMLLKIAPLRQSLWPNLPLMKRSMGFAARAFLILLFGFMLSRMPVIALGMQGDSRSVGLVSVVIQFSDVLLIVPSSVAAVLFPQLVSGRETDLAVKTLKATAWVVGLMTAVCSILALASTPLIEVMFGGAFVPSAEALRWALPGFVLLSAVNVFGQFLAAAGFPYSTVLAWALATAVGYGLSPSESSADAPRQAMVALSCAYGVLAIAMAAIFARELQRYPRKAEA